MTKRVNSLKGQRSINAGNYDKRITIAKKIPHRLEDGTEGDPIMVPILNCYARIRTVSGYTMIRNDSDFENAKVCFFIRYSKRVEDAYKGKVLDYENWDLPMESSKRNLYVLFDDEQYEVVYFNHINKDKLEIELQTKLVTGYG